MPSFCITNTGLLRSIVRRPRGRNELTVAMEGTPIRLVQQRSVASTQRLQIRQPAIGVLPRRQRTILISWHFVMIY
jgi:hypothetical protein